MTLAQGSRGLSLHLHGPLTLEPGVVQGFVAGTMIDKYAPCGGWKQKEEDAGSQYCFQKRASNNLRFHYPVIEGQGNDQAFDEGFWDTNIKVSEGFVEKVHHYGHVQSDFCHCFVGWGNSLFSSWKAMLSFLTDWVLSWQISFNY